MPELPEVTTIVTDLKKNVLGWTVKDITTPDQKHLKDKTITNVTRVAKNIVFEFDGQIYLVIHLNMTGRLLLRSPNFKPDNYLKATITLQKSKKVLELRFCDKRGWAKMQIMRKRELQTLTNKYGINPLEKSITAQNLLDALKQKSSTIKSVLLEQAIIAGIGNIYTTEALWLAGIHPKTKTGDITLEQAATLLEAIRQMLTAGIEHRGVSISDYVDIFGKPGTFQELLAIYRKEICPKCTNKIEMEKINGRSTYFCPTCQK